MYTYDEWGNIMFHIQTGREGIEAFRKMGIKNPSKEAYEKHMNSYRKIREEQDKKFQETLNKVLEWCKS